MHCREDRTREVLPLPEIPSPIEGTLRTGDRGAWPAVDQVVARLVTECNDQTGLKLMDQVHKLREPGHDVLRVVLLEVVARWLPRDTIREIYILPAKSR